MRPQSRLKAMRPMSEWRSRIDQSQLATAIAILYTFY